MARWLLLIMLAGLAFALTRQVRTRSTAQSGMSRAWLTEQAKQEHMCTFEGVTWTWPINKTVNDNGPMNRWILRHRSATVNATAKSIGIPSREVCGVHAVGAGSSRKN